MKLPDVWGLLKEMDLEAVRREADRPFQVLVIGHPDDAETVADLLSGAEHGRHPWILCADPAEARRRAGSGLIDLAVIVTRPTDPEPILAATREVLSAARVPFVSVLVATAARSADAVVRGGEAARAILPALGGDAVGPLVEAVLEAAPTPLRLPLARQLPPLRHAVIGALIEDAARTNALYSLTTGLAEAVPVLNVPLNLADVVVLTKNQLLMSYRIALAAGKRGRGRELLAEVAGVIGSGLLFRQAGRSLVGLIPGVGIVPKVGVAYAGTIAIGRAVSVWAQDGEKLTKASVRGYYLEASRRAKGVAKDLVGRAKSLTPRLPGRKRS
ncbi:MAG: hypothetical protein ABW221_18210 [Vicinamibacteria bacterium]